MSKTPESFNKTGRKFYCNLGVPLNTALCDLGSHLNQLCPRGRGNGSFLVEKYCSCVGGGAFVVSAIVKIPGVPRGQPPGWPLII